MRPLPYSMLAAVVILGLAACAPTEAGEVGAQEATAADFVLTSPDLDAEGYLPEWAVGRASGFCEGENRSPQLEWTGAPEGTAGFVVTMTDPAFPSYTHWIVTDISADASSLESAPDGEVASGVVGMSGAGAGLYVGPCVVDNGYVYTVHAVGVPVVGDGGTTIVDLAGLMGDRVLASAELVVKRR